MLLKSVCYPCRHYGASLLLNSKWGERWWLLLEPKALPLCTTARLRCASVGKKKSILWAQNSSLHPRNAGQIILLRSTLLVDTKLFFFRTDIVTEKKHRTCDGSVGLSISVRLSIPDTSPGHTTWSTGVSHNSYDGLHGKCHIKPSQCESESARALPCSTQKLQQPNVIDHQFYYFYPCFVTWQFGRAQPKLKHIKGIQPLLM